MLLRRRAAIILFLGAARLSWNPFGPESMLPMKAQTAAQSEREPSKPGLLAVRREEVPDLVLKEAIGIATVWCMYEGMGSPEGYSPRETYWLAEARRRGSAIDRYELTGTRFHKVAPIEVARLIPLSKFAHEGVIRRFPATRQMGDYIETIYDVKKDLRCWLKVTPEDAEGCRVEFLSLTREGAIMMEVDLDSLLRGKAPRLYAAPSRKAKSVELGGDPTPPEMQDGGIMYLSAIRNGFGLLTFEDCEGKIKKSVGWVPLRDEKSRLIVWQCDGCGGCC